MSSCSACFHSPLRRCLIFLPASSSSFSCRSEMELLSCSITLKAVGYIKLDVPQGVWGGISQCLIECLGLEGIPKPNQFQPLAVGSATQQHRLLRAPSSLALSASRVGAPTVSMGSCARVSLPSQGRTSP